MVILNIPRFLGRLRTKLVFPLFILCHVTCCQSQLISPISRLTPLPAPTGAEFRNYEILNGETPPSILEWEVDRAANTITFKFFTNLNNTNSGTVILLGLSRTGYVAGADVVAVGGIGPVTDAAFLVDMYGSDNATARRDPTQNWQLVGVHQNFSTVLVIVSRPLVTCDLTNDVPINRDLLRVIWGRTSSTSWIVDRESINFTPEGSFRAYLTDPRVTPRNGLQSWRVSRRFRVPPKRTTYWCSIHRGLSLPRKHHITGFRPYFGDFASSQHVHHQLVYRCQAPPGIDASLIFEKYVNHPGEECYLMQNHTLPTIFCTEIIHIWGLGGTAFNLPNDLGIPLGENRNEYFLFESHYDNPDMRSDLTVVNGVDFQYSPTLRQNEGGIIFVGTGVFGLLQVPPRTANFTSAGHCSPECTRQMFPPTGVEVVATMLHAHMSTRQMTLKNFRGNQELPWVQRDGNYDYSFQQLRLLPQPVRILPGDQMTTECVFDTSSRSGITLSGFSTVDEMCVTFILVKSRVPFLYCTSEYPPEQTLRTYGVREFEWDPVSQERVVTSAVNPAFVGLTLSQVVDRSVTNWTPAMISNSERQQLYQPHRAVCPPVREMEMLAYLGLFLDSLTLGIFNGRALFEASRPNTRTMSTPGGTNPNRTVLYPANARRYWPDTVCRA